MIYSLKEQLRQNLHKYIHCSPEALDALWSRVQFKKVAKKDFLLKEGQICNYRFLMVKGLVRFYYLESSGHEKIVAFGIENWWMTHLESHQHLPDEMFDRLQTYFNKEEIAYLSLAIAQINVWNRLMIAFQFEPGKYQVQQ